MMKRRSAVQEAFTVIELIVVMAVILVLAGLILSVSGYANQKGRTSRAEAEIKALEAACESYKADNGDYPATTGTALDPSKNSNPTNYSSAAADLYVALSGSAASGSKSYFNFNATMIRTDGNVTAVVDPFRNYYGYSRSGTYNPTFDLWSTANVEPLPDGSDTSALQKKWIKNW